MNVQLICDSLQKHGIKKPAIQKALDTLASPASTAAEDDGEAEGQPKPDEGTPVIYKDYGKQRIYMARQDNLDVLSAAQMEASKQRISTLEAEAKQLLQECSSLDRGQASTVLTGDDAMQLVQQRSGQCSAGCQRQDIVESKPFAGA